MKSNSNLSIIRKKIILFICLFIFIAYLLFGFYNPLRIKKYEIYHALIPKSFEDFKIVQLTDFHCKSFGKNEDTLIQAISEQKPDIIVLTGDFIDENHPIDNMEHLLKGIRGIAPVYYITGNHEYINGTPFHELLSLFEKYNVNYLCNKTVKLSRKNDFILLSGLDYNNAIDNLKNTINYADTNYYNILLYHGSNYFDLIANYNYNLVLSGHVHGGIVRLPLIGGLLGNDNQFFPKYDYGKFVKQNSTLISSSGLGDAFIPRFYNPREVVCITLHHQSAD